jgi:hypothetical protein
VYRMYYSCIPSKPAGKGETIKCRNCRREVPDNTVICPCGWCPSSELHQRMFGNLAYVEVTHGVVDPDRRGGLGGAYLLVQKRDRFAGVRAGHAGGEIITRPLVFSGNRLEINVDCGGLGEAWVEILDAEGKPIPGFELERFDVIDMNHIHAPCAWMDNPDVGAVAGRPVKLRIKLRAATLYSLRIVSS